MIVIALLLAFASVAGAEPRAGTSTFEVDAGAALFHLDENNGGVDAAVALRLAIGRYWSDRFALGLQFVDHAVTRDSGGSRQLDNPMTLVVAGQWWIQPTLFAELGVGDTFEQSGFGGTGPYYGGWTVAARAGIVVSDNVVLSAHVFHTWLSGAPGPGSTNAVAFLVGWML